MIKVEKLDPRDNSRGFLTGGPLLWFFAGGLICFITGCGSVEFNLARKRGDKPWFVLSPSASDPTLQLKRVPVYKLVRKASSKEGQKEGLKTDKTWGEGLEGSEWKEHGEILTHVNVDVDEDHPEFCLFNIRVEFSSEVSSSAYTVGSSTVGECEKGPFDNPVFIGKFPKGRADWLTVEYQFHK